MRYRPLLRLFGATALTFTLINSAHPDLLAGFSGQGWQLQGEAAFAKSSSGGRAKGGSFSRPSSSGSSRSNSSSPSNSSGSSRTIYRSNGGPVIIHSSGGTTSSSSLDWLWMLLICGGGSALILYILWKFNNSPSASQELENNTVTVTKLQVALLAQAKQIQTDLTELALSADTETPEGLTELLHESVIALLRSPENWSHVGFSSQTFKTREEAGQQFEQISITERSKFTAETLVNVGGRVRQTSTATKKDDSEPAAYVVVTLIVGTEDDRPLFDKIHSTEELTTALQRLGSITQDYLAIFEMIWTPQNEKDSLSRDELLAEYPHLIQIA